MDADTVRVKPDGVGHYICEVYHLETGKPCRFVITGVAGALLALLLQHAIGRDNEDYPNDH